MVEIQTNLACRNDLGEKNVLFYLVKMFNLLKSIKLVKQKVYFIRLVLPEDVFQ